MHTPGKHITNFLILIMFATGIGCACFFAGLLCYLLASMPVNITQLLAHEQGYPSIVLDCQGNLITQFARDKRTPITYKECAQTLINAFVAAEDHHFFTHWGISIKGIARSLVTNIRHGRIVQGGSTITQQLARLAFLSCQRHWSRKLQEALIALQLERQCSKQQIMELYLNSVYFGRGIYGVQAACQRFWGIDANQLTPEQAATLATVAKSARLYSPLNDPENALRGRNIILRSMHRLGFLNHEQYHIASTTPLLIHEKPATNTIRQYVCEEIRVWAEQRFGKDALYTNGLVIKTGIDLHAQEQAEQQFKNVVEHLRSKSGQPIDGGLVCLDANSGAIRAMIGGYDFTQSQFNRALNAYRQAGSSFKPILYARAVQQGFTLNHVEIDEPLEITQHDGSVWKPKNWDRKFHGRMTLARALTTSSNIASIKLLAQLGPASLSDWVAHFGYNQPYKPYLSSALGTLETSVVENAAAFNVFANNGYYTRPWLIDQVRDRHGKMLWMRTPHQHLVLDASTNSIMVNALSHRMRIAQPLFKDKWLTCECIGKTGGTNGAVSLWFVGSTPSHTTAVYLGRDDGAPMGRSMFASKTAFPLWALFMRTLQHPITRFYQSADVIPMWIDWTDGSKRPPNDPDAISILVPRFAKNRTA